MSLDAPVVGSLLKTDRGSRFRPNLGAELPIHAAWLYRSRIASNPSFVHHRIIGGMLDDIGGS
jgi:hypothetical protein